MTSTQPQPTGFNHPHMSPRQAKWLFDLINSRVGNGPALPSWKATYFAIQNRADFEKAINTLKALPVLAGESNRPALATEEGLYRDPINNILYRVTEKDGAKGKYLAVSQYSNKPTLRRTLVSGEEVLQGSWSYVGTVRKVGVLAEWQMTDTDKVEYVTGICNFCYRGLVDSRSLRHNYGPTCAKKHNLPWGGASMKSKREKHRQSNRERTLAVQELRRSSAASPQSNVVPRREERRQAIQDQED
jgi:hypothetical protein